MKDRAVWLTNRAFEHSFLREDDAALADLRQALEVDANDPYALNNLAYLLSDGPLRLRDLDKALKLAQKAVALASKPWTARHTLGVVYYRLGRYDKAIVALERSLRESQAEEAPVQLLFLAMCHARLGDAPQAKECRDRAARWTPPHPERLPRNWKELVDHHY